MMNLANALTLASVVFLLVAAWRDIATRTIPDTVSLGLAASGFALRAPSGVAAFAVSAAVAVLLFLILVLLHARGALGGGDVKLAAAMALGLPPLATFDFLLATGLAGGVLGLLYLALGRLSAPALSPVGNAAWLPRRILAVEWRRIRRRGPLPYAVAIAIGGILTLLQPVG